MPLLQLPDQGLHQSQQLADQPPISWTKGIGIAAWFQASTPITLADVRDAFRTIEAETSTYIIGSVPVTNYGETEDVHAYVHTDGWIMAYHLATDPVGKIYDWRVYHDGGRSGITTKLENTISVLADAATVPFLYSATYYHFRYSNAIHKMLIVEWVLAATDSFELKLPGTFAYYERSWSLGSDEWGCSRYLLDGEQIQIHPQRSYWRTAQGVLTTAQLLPDEFHSIEVVEDCGGTHYTYGGLALVYRVP